MEAATKRHPTLFILSCIFFLVGVVCLGLSFVLQLEPNIFKGMVYISLAFLAFGTGEIINHPKQRLINPVIGKDATAPQMYRKRNVCSLGNLFDIGALLLFFVGLAALFFPTG